MLDVAVNAQFRYISYLQQFHKAKINLKATNKATVIEGSNKQESEAI